MLPRRQYTLHHRQYTPPPTARLSLYRLWSRMTTKTVIDPLVSHERGTQEAGIVGMFSIMIIQVHTIDNLRNTGNATFDGRSVKTDLIMNT